MNPILYPNNDWTKLIKDYAKLDRLWRENWEAYDHQPYYADGRCVSHYWQDGVEHSCWSELVKGFKLRVYREFDRDDIEEFISIVFKNEVDPAHLKTVLEHPSLYEQARSFVSEFFDLAPIPFLDQILTVKRFVDRMMLERYRGKAKSELLA